MLSVVFVGCDEENPIEVVDGVNIEIHHQGETCSSCHGSNGSEVRLYAAGSIFKSLSAGNNEAAQIALGHTLRLVLNSTTKYLTVGNGDGNAHSKSAVLSEGFTAEVLDASGDVVNSASHSANQLDCNSCHTSTGSSGAPGRVVNFRNE